MPEGIQVKQYVYVTPPRAHQSPLQVGEVVAFAVSAVAAYLEMDNLLQQPVGTITPAQQKKGVLDNFVTIFADAADLGIVFGPSAASVSAGNAPVLATVGTVSGAGAYTAAAGTCFRIPAGQSARFHLQRGVDAFMGYVASAAGTCRLYQSSPAVP